VSTTAPPVALADRVTKTYETALRSTRALDEVSAAFHRDRLSVVAGPSGSGKSTLLRILAGLDVPTEGEVSVCGTSLETLGGRGRRRLRRESVAFLFQRPSDNLVSYLTAEQHLRLAAELRRAPGRAPADVLEEVGIAHAAARRPHELSGGEQQRLAVAAAIVVTPALLLLDEPTAELDRENAENVVALLRTAAAGGTAVVVSSHDPIVTDAADDLVELVDGRVRS
jgi:putative ABC transport system ATP-binding protein